MRQKKLLQILKENFGHSSFRFEQENIINSILDGVDTLAIMPTGGGKSACYQVPALYLKGVTLVISPLISLMEDQVSNLKENGIRSCFLNSSLSYDAKKEIMREIKNGDHKIVYVSPEGILRGELLEFFKSVEVSLIAIDEAHCVSQWGHEFRNDYTRLGDLRDSFKKVPVLALTATADKRTRDDICSQLRMGEFNVFISSFDRPNIKYEIAERENEIEQLDLFIKNNHSHETGIVYCLSRKKVEKVANDLKKIGYNAHPYHAGLSTDKRSKIQRKFNVESGIIIVATIAFGMGIDRPDVRFVVHLDLPKSIEGYYQETGRAGRDGEDSSAYMLYGLQDIIKLSQMLENTDANEFYKKVAKEKLNSMLALCETIKCKRQYLLKYFGEESKDRCESCDSCLTPAEKVDATVDAQKILSVIYRTGQMFGANYVIEVLRGSRGTKILERGHDKISAYGVGKDKSKNYWNILLRQLLNLNYVQIKNFEYRSLGLNQKSGEILKGFSSFEMRKREDKVSKVKSNKSIESTHGREDLFEQLRSVRKKLASQNNVPPYVIFSDKSLHDMCQILPRDKEEFLMVNGVGISKCDKYASDFLNQIASYTIK